MPRYPFKQIDVFTEKPFGGNPVAVIFRADDIPEEEMRRISRWTNLSETTFVCSSSRGDYRLRIFTPGKELPFAGHPTIGSAHGVLEAGFVSRDRTTFTQDCLSGIIPLERDSSGAIYARVPRPRILSAGFNEGMMSTALGPFAWVEPMLIDVGPHWIVTRLLDFDALYRLRVSTEELIDLSREFEATGVTVYTLDESSRVHVRSFAPVEGVFEDPVCGSGNAAVAAHIRASGLHETIGTVYTAHQGAALGRDGRIEVKIEGEDVTIGGHAVTVVDGTISI